MEVKETETTSVLDHFRAWELTEDAFEIDKNSKLGSGTFADVFRGKMIGDGPDGRWKAGEIVAIKVCRKMKNVISDFKLARELLIPCCCKVPGIVPFVGFVRPNEDRGPIMVTKFITNGSFQNVLDQRRAKKKVLGWSDQKFAASMYTVAKVMAFLNEHGFMHRDIKPENILFNKEGAMLADFGTARPINTRDLDISNDVGSPFFMAPEVYDEHFDCKADVYSFAMTMYSWWMGKNIHYDDGTSIDVLRETEFQLRRKVKSGIRFKNINIPPVYWDLITRCWDPNPELRPSFSEICEMMETNDEFSLAKDNLKKKKYKDETASIKRRVKGTMSEDFKEAIEILKQREWKGSYTYTPTTRTGPGSEPKMPVRQTGPS